jgi:hypothetical protein
LKIAVLYFLALFFAISNKQDATGRKEGALVTGTCAGRTNREMVDFNNISCNTVKDFAMEYLNFYEEGTLRRV